MSNEKQSISVGNEMFIAYVGEDGHTYRTVENGEPVRLQRKHYDDHHPEVSHQEIPKWHKGCANGGGYGNGTFPLFMLFVPNKGPEIRCRFCQKVVPDEEQEEKP